MGFLHALNLHLPVLPVLLPALTALVLSWLGSRPDGTGPSRRAVVRAVGLTSLALGALLSWWLLQRTADGELLVYRLGNWPAPFGVVLVIDRLSALMLMLTSAVAWPVLWHASAGFEARGRHFPALFQWQIMGLMGAFSTGDLFNLFVFFEVLLIASYALMVHGQGAPRLRAGLHYVVLNLLASALFLIGVSLLYGTTGTLNLADLALRMGEVHGSQALMARIAGMVLMVVFGFKAALAPLSLWLPTTYARAGAPVAALFAIMTKVGIYAIVRVHGVVFGPFAGESALAMAGWLLPLALLTCLMGALGVLSARTLPRLVGWLTLVSVGTILAGIGLFTSASWSAALYYSVHSTLVVAALFLLVEQVASQRGEVADRLEPSGPMAHPVRLGCLVLVAGASVVGLPPLPGFLGKVMLLQAAVGHERQGWVWGMVLLVSFFSLMALARAGSLVFWSVRAKPLEGSVVAGGGTPWLGPTVMLLVASAALSVWAAPVKRFTDAAAYQLHDLQAYGRAVLGVDPETGEVLRPVRAFTGDAPTPGVAP